MKNGEDQICLVMEYIHYTFIWWDFSKVQLYVPHLYGLSFIVDAEYSRKSAVEGCPLAQCHHSWSQIQKYSCV